MKLFRVLLALCLTSTFFYYTSNRIPLSTPVPPLARFLDPFHGFWQNSYNNPEKGPLLTDGLSKPVRIVYDSSWIPHLYAQTEEDLYFAQGFVTARDRLWQMEFQTHAAAGRIAEIMGAGKDSVFLNYDRDQRRMGMMFAAENCLSAIRSDSVMYRLAKHYTNGVNKYIQSLDYENFPLEYKLLDYSPEPWSEIKIALLLKSMARTLNSGEKDMEMTNALQLLGPEMLDLLFPDREQVADPIVNRAGQWPKPLPADTVPLAVPKEMVRVITSEKTEKDIGSNNWAVAGSKTATGKPILCNDPHLQLSLPSIWYTIHLSAPGYNTMGASLPGSPGVISGFNDSIAWGETNAQRDLVDWYRIEFRDGKRQEYKMDNGWKPTRLQVEKIQVRGAGEMIDSVIYTEHGPVRYDKHFKAKNDRFHFAYRWVTHEASNEMRTFYELNKARNISDYHRALNHYSAPAQNFVFASVQGDIAMRIQGRFPIRRPNEGRFILDGTVSTTNWRRFIPNEHQVMEENPIRGFVSSANQYPADSTYPYYIMSSSYEAFRNRRINQRLAEMDSVTAEDMMALHSDNHGLKAAEALPLLLPLVRTEGLTADEKKALEVLRSWDYGYTVESPAAAWFDSWWNAFMMNAWDEFRDQPHELPIPTSFQTIHLIRIRPELQFFDKAATPEKETLADIANLSFKEAVETVMKWKNENDNKEPLWADFKNTSVEHLLRLPALSRFVRASGNREVVNATSRRAGPSWRMVVSMENPIRAWGVYPGGQSGRPGHPAYDNMIGPWSRGEYIELKFAPEAGLKPMHVLELNPKP